MEKKQVPVFRLTFLIVHGHICNKYSVCPFLGITGFFCTDMATKVVLYSPCLHSIHIRLCSHFTRLLFKTKSPIGYSTAMNTYLICDSSLYSQIDGCATQSRSVTKNHRSCVCRSPNRCAWFSSRCKRLVRT